MIYRTIITQIQEAQHSTERETLKVYPVLRIGAGEHKMTNYTANGAKYSTDGSHVEIRSAQPHNDYDVTIYIHNFVNGDKTAYDIDVDEGRVVEKRMRTHDRTMKTCTGHLSTVKVREIVNSEWGVTLEN